MDSIFSAKFSDIFIYIFIPIVVGILTIALPLLIQIINKIDEKYSSSVIVSLFNKSWQNILFKRTLIISLILIFVYAIQIPPIDFSNSLLQKIVDNSAIKLVFLSVAILLFSLLFFILLEKKYNDSYLLADFLIRRYKKNNNITYFKAISELLYYSIKTSNEELSRKLLTAITEFFIIQKKGKEGEYINYPIEYYDAICNANELICLNEPKATSVLNGSVMLNLLIEDYQKTRISNDTYICIWRCMRQCLFYPNNENLIKSYWGWAHQYISYYLKPISALYNDNFSAITNTREIEERELEIKKFKEFHYVLGALLLNSSRLSLLKEIMSHSNMQTPLPVYYLVPNSFHTLFSDYFSFEDGWDNSFYYRQYYSFPQISGVQSNDIIFMWIQRYFAILFIRQYGIPERYTSAPYQINLPQLPTTLSELTKLKPKIESLKRWVSFYIEEEKTLKELELIEFYQKEILTKNNQEPPIKVIEDYIVEIDKKYDEIKEQQPIVQSKHEEFNDESVRIIKNHLTPILSLTNKTKVDDSELEFSSFVGQPRHDILEKGAFSENQDVHYTNSLQITAQAICMEIDHYFTISFAIVRNKKQYLVSFEELFEAIDKLKVDNNYIIVSMGISISHRMNFYKPEGLIESDGKFKYKEVEIVEVGYSQMDSLNRALYVINKEDLPSFTMHELQKTTIGKFGYKLIDDEFKIYTSVLNLNEHQLIREKIEETCKEGDNLKEKVLACVGVSYELRWSKNAQYIQIKEFDSYRESNKKSALDEIKPIIA